MNRIILNHIELTELNGKLWIYDRAEGVGIFVTDSEIAELLKQRSLAANEAQTAITKED